jgi:nucleoid-associated protein YejK
MIKPEELQIKKIIIHILDTSITIPVMSMDEMPTSIDMNDFFAHHISKTINDDAQKNCVFSKEYNLFLNYLNEYRDEKIDFVTFSKQIAGQLFAIMSAHISIPSADLAVIQYRYNTKDYLALLKLNYQNTFIHFTDYESDVNVNTIIQHRTTLPNYGQKVAEAAIIDLETLDVKLLDKLVELDGEKKHYLSTLFFKCHTKLSSKEQMQAVQTATNKVAKKYFDTDIEKKAAITEKLYSNLNDEGELDLDAFAKEAFPAQEEAKEIFFSTLEKKGVDEPKIAITEKTISRTFEKQRIKTDEGVEIKIPMDFYNNPQKMEFVTEANGKISIIIKDINKIM